MTSLDQSVGRLKGVIGGPAAGCYNRADRLSIEEATAYHFVL